MLILLSTVPKRKFVVKYCYVEQNAPSSARASLCSKSRHHESSCHPFSLCAADKAVLHKCTESLLKVLKGRAARHTMQRSSADSSIREVGKMHTTYAGLSSNFLALDCKSMS